MGPKESATSVSIRGKEASHTPEAGVRVAGRLERCDVRHRGMWETSRSWRSLGDGLPWSLQKNRPSVCLRWVRLTLDFMPRAVEESMCLVLSYFVCGLKLKAQIGCSGIGNLSSYSYDRRGQSCTKQHVLCPTFCVCAPIFAD